MNDDKVKSSHKGKNNASGMNSVSIREEYSLNELKTMLSDIDKVVSKTKAEQEGADPKDMIKTVRGGRVVWITKEEMNAILAKQRRVVGKRYQQRSIRGDDSLTSEVTRRVESCKRLVKLLRKLQPERSADLIRLLREIQVIHNHSISLSRETRMLEEAIQRKKKDDPLLSEMNQATSEMVSALQRNEIDEVDVCRSFFDQNIDEYAAKQKRLNPYIQKARECRTALIQCKKEMYLHEFNLLALGDDLLTEPLQKMVYFDKEDVVASPMVKCADDIRTLILESRPKFQTLEVFDIEKLEKRMDFFQLESPKFDGLDSLFGITQPYDIPRFSQSSCVPRGFS